MKFVLAIALILCMASSEVIVLNDSNFEELTQMTTGSTTGSWFVKFYAPWCGHCKNLAPVWEELADELNGEVNVAEVDATANNELARLYEIEGFPTLFFFESGKYVAYEGERSLEAMKEFALGGYQDLTMKACPRPPTEFEKKVQILRDYANRSLADRPFTTCLVLMGSGALVGIIATLIFFFCSKKEEFEPVSDAKKND